jgi:hypothetical protein
MFYWDNREVMVYRPQCDEFKLCIIITLTKYTRMTNFISKTLICETPVYILTKFDII